MTGDNKHMHDVTTERVLRFGVTVGTVALLVIGATVLVAGGAAADTTDTEQSVTATNSTISPADDGESAFLVDLDTNGSADVTVTYTFDLTEDDRQDAFEDLRENDADRETFRERFEDRMTSVAADAAEASEREMSVSNGTIEFETVDNTGVVILSITWHELAAVTDDELIVTEPFASGFEPDRTFYLSFPAEYEATAVTPDADAHGEQYLSWDAGADLSGFEVVVTATEDGADEDETTDTETADDTADDEVADTADDDGPGFGIIGALAALGGVGYLLNRRLGRGPATLHES